MSDDGYTYVFQLCGDAGGVPGAGVIQIDDNEKEKKPTVVGTYDTTQAIGGSKCQQNPWILSVLVCHMILLHDKSDY